MAKQNLITRNYNMSDAELFFKAQFIKDMVAANLADFSQRGVDDDTLSDFDTLNNHFIELPDDMIMKGEGKISTEDKDAQALKLRQAIRTLRTMVKNKMGHRSRAYRVYKFERLNQTSDETLHRLARAVRLIAPGQLAELQSEGFTQVMLDNINQLDTDFELAIDTQLTAQAEREIKTQERIEAGNLVYKEMMRLCNIGKDLYNGIDGAKFSEFIVYTSPAAKKKPETE